MLCRLWHMRKGLYRSAANRAVIVKNQLSLRLNISEDSCTQLVDRKRLPTNTTTANHPVHRWFNFIAGFSPEFVDYVCDRSIGLDFRNLLLDPFAGCGTALVQAALRGVQAIGYEAHPFFERICKGKLDMHDAPRQLHAIEEVLRRGFDHPVSVDSLSEAPHSFFKSYFPCQSSRNCWAPDSRSSSTTS
jgi:hypothetical protein